MPKPTTLSIPIYRTIEVGFSSNPHLFQSSKPKVSACLTRHSQWYLLNQYLRRAHNTPLQPPHSIPNDTYSYRLAQIVSFLKSAVAYMERAHFVFVQDCGLVYSIQLDPTILHLHGNFLFLIRIGYGNCVNPMNRNIAHEIV